MKRRKFLGLLGGAITAPMMPLPALGQAAAAPFGKATMHAAILHAKVRASFSAFGLAQALNLPITQAEQLMEEMASRGMLGQLKGTTYGGRWAVSNLSKPQIFIRPRKQTGPETDAVSHGQTKHHEPDLSLLLAHLRGLANRYFAPQLA